MIETACFYCQRPVTGRVSMVRYRDGLVPCHQSCRNMAIHVSPEGAWRPRPTLIRGVMRVNGMVNKPKPTKGKLELRLREIEDRQLILLKQTYTLSECVEKLLANAESFSKHSDRV